MSLAFYLYTKCLKKLEDNISLVTKKLSNPDEIINFEASGTLVEAAKGGMGALGTFAESYLNQNGEALIFAALDATPVAKYMHEAYALFQNALAAAIMAQNNLIYRMVKELSWSILEEISKKDKQLLEMSDTLRELYSALATLLGTDYWNDYYADLRKALSLVASTRTDLQLVYNTLFKKDYWLSRRFNGTIDKLNQAKLLITPQENNPAVARASQGGYKTDKSLAPTPDRSDDNSMAETVKTVARNNQIINQKFQRAGDGLAILGDGLTDNWPMPTTPQSVQAAMAVGRLSNTLLIQMQGYFSQTNKINSMIDAFKIAVDNLRIAIPGFLKERVLQLLQKTYTRVNTLTNTMALILNGSQDAITGPVRGFKPNSLAITVNGFKWIADINLILASYESIPTKALDQLALDRGAAEKLKSIVARLDAMYPGGTIRSGGGRMSMTGAIEELGQLESQMLTFVLEANASIVNAMGYKDVKKAVLALGKATLGRLELALRADSQISGMMLEWYNYPLPQTEMLEKLFNGLKRMLEDAGLDRVLAALESGDYEKLFTLKGMGCTFVGGALAAIALLKSCKLSKDETDNLNELTNELNADMDLFNFNFSINFDFAIFKNLQDCLRLNGLGDLFTAKELLCGIAQDISNGNITNLSKMYDKMVDAFTISSEIK